MYKQPKNTIRYEILSIMHQGNESYVVMCYYTRNKYVFFGESVIKSKLLQSIGWSSAGEYHTDVIFYTQGSARKTISDINNNSVKLVESITK